MKPDYQEVSSLALVASKFISDEWTRLGKPQTPFSQSGKKMMELIIKSWQELYPLDAQAFLQQRATYQNNELSISQQVSRHTGRSLASYPYPVYQLMKKIFKGFDPAERKNCMRLVKIWPIFKLANKV